MQEHSFTGRIAGLVIFRVPEFGTRAQFIIEDTGPDSVVCTVEGDIAREFTAHYCEGDNIAVRGIYEPRPSTAAANTPWVPRYHVRAVQIAEATGMRPDHIHETEIRCCCQLEKRGELRDAIKATLDHDVKVLGARDYRFPVDRHAVHRCLSSGGQ